MARFLLCNSHVSSECPVVYAAWKGFESPLRRSHAQASCSKGPKHRIWWEIEAADEREALATLPPYVAERTEAFEVGEVPIP